MDEYIKREDALAICEEEYREQLRILNYAGDSVAWNIGHAIKELPAADVAPVVHGRWIKDNDSFQTDDDYYCCYFDYNCSNCGEVVNDRYKLPKYCPECGAKMDGKEAA